MNNKPFDARSDARLNHDAPGLGDDIQCSKCGISYYQIQWGCPYCGYPRPPFYVEDA